MIATCQNERLSVLCNPIFILPLVGILIIGYLGVKFEYMGNFLRRRLAIFKFGMAVLFAGLGLLVMGTMIVFICILEAVRRRTIRFDEEVKMKSLIII